MAQLNSLLVTGDSRFLNKIHGTIENSDAVGGHETPASGNATSDQVVLGNDSRLTNARTPTSHSHGNIQNGGTLQTTDITIASGDKLVVTDSSDSSKIARASISFDGSTTTKCLTQKGTWESFGTGGGDVTGPSSSTSGNITTFSSGTGKAIQDSGKTFSTGSTDTTATHVVLCNDTRLSDSRTPKSHTHGNIQNNGTLQTTDVAVQNGDKLVVTDANASTANSVVRSSIAFDASTATKCLTQKGTWESFSNNTGTITSVKTTAGAHTTINVTSGAANFNVPTKTSHLTNDSGYVTTDTTYTLDTSNNNITLTPSSGSTQSITAPYSNSSGGIHYCETDASSTSTAFIVNDTGITSLISGNMLCIKNTKVTSAANCTLNVNGLGAKRIWLSQSNSYCTTHWGLNQAYLFVYDGSNERWVLQQGRDTNDNDTYTIRPYYSHPTVGGNGIKQYGLFARLLNNTYASFTTNNGTGTKTFDTTNYFDPTKLFYYNGSGNLASGAVFGSNTFSMSVIRADLRYSFNGVTTSSSTSSIAGNKPVFMVFDKTSENKGCYKLKSPYWTQTPSDTSALYVLVGYAEDSYRMDLWIDNPLFTWDGTDLVRFTSTGSNSGGTKVYIESVDPPYNAGDLWFSGDSTYYCITSRASGDLDMDDWVIVSSDLNSDEVSAIVKQEISVALGNNGGNIVWHDGDGDNIPDEILVLRNENDLTHPATIDNATIVWRFDNNGLSYSLNGYRGTYYPIINQQGKGVADFLQTGTLDASKVTIANFNSAMITAGLLKRGGLNNQFGEIELYNEAGVLIGLVNNTGFTWYGSGQVGQRPCITINDTEGFVGYDTDDPNIADRNKIFEVTLDEFRMKKCVAQQEMQIGGKARFVPITISSNGTVVNDGIALVAMT